MKLLWRWLLRNHTRPDSSCCIVHDHVIKRRERVIRIWMNMCICTYTCMAVSSTIVRGWYMYLYEYVYMYICIYECICIVCMHVSICIHECIYTCIYIRADMTTSSNTARGWHAYVWICVYIHTYVNMYIYIYICMYVSIYVYIHMYLRTCYHAPPCHQTSWESNMHTYVWICKCMYVGICNYILLCVCVCVCLCLCVCVRGQKTIHTLNMYTCTLYVYTGTLRITHIYISVCRCSWLSTIWPKWPVHLCICICIYTYTCLVYIHT